MLPVNYWAIIVAAILRMVVGSIWYSPVAFVKPWQALTGVTPESMQKGLAKAIVVDLILSIVMAFAIANIVVGSNITGWLNGALAGVWLWLGFVVATHLPLWAYENRPLKLIAINAGSNLVSIVLMTILLTIWR